MKVEITIEDEYLDSIASQVIIDAKSAEDKEIARQAKQKCLSETIVLKPEIIGDEATQLQLGMAAFAFGQVAQELENEKKKN